MGRMLLAVCQDRDRCRPCDSTSSFGMETPVSARELGSCSENRCCDSRGHCPRASSGCPLTTPQNVTEWTEKLQKPAEKELAAKREKKARNLAKRSAA